MIQKYLITFIIILIIIIYIQYYYKFKNDFKINQVYLDKIDMNLVNEKYPIVIYDKIIEPKQLLKTLFAYTYNISSDFPLLFENKVYINLAKYQIIYNQLSDIDINIIHPQFKNKIEFIQSKDSNTIHSRKTVDNLNIEYLTIKLKQNQILILQTFWMYTSQLPIQTILLNDFASYSIDILNRKFKSKT
jgi:hypothetical protein